MTTAVSEYPDSQRLAPPMFVVRLLPFGDDMAAFMQAVRSPPPVATPSADHYFAPEPPRPLLAPAPADDGYGYPEGGSRKTRLTPRERQVCDRIKEGLSNKQIARALGIAIHTVKCHVHNVLEKLGVDSRVQVAVFGWRGRGQ